MISSSPILTQPSAIRRQIRPLRRRAYYIKTAQTPKATKKIPIFLKKVKNFPVDAPVDAGERNGRNRPNAASASNVNVPFRPSVAKIVNIAQTAPTVRRDAPFAPPRRRFSFYRADVCKSSRATVFRQNFQKAGGAVKVDASRPLPTLVALQRRRRPGNFFRDRVDVDRFPSGGGRQRSQRFRLDIALDSADGTVEHNRKRLRRVSASNRFR